MDRMDPTHGYTGTSMPTSSPTNPGNTATLVTADIVVLVAYFVLMMAVCFWSMTRMKRSTVDGYFLAGKSMTWWPVGASLFASNVGSLHFIALAGSAAAAGIGAVVYEWTVGELKHVFALKGQCLFSLYEAMVSLVLLGWLFLPIYTAAGVTTMPEYLQKRFGGKRIQLFITVFSLVIYIFTKISVDIYAGALFIQMALKWNIYLAVILLLSITALYTVAGGLAAVIYTDAAQTVIMLAGSLTLMGFSFAEVGGWDAMMDGYFKAIPSVRVPNSTCGLPRADSFHIFRDPVTSDLPWPGILIGMTIPSMWYWCSDQVIVQRSLAAKNLTHAKGGSLLAAYLKVLPFFIIMLPGMISRILYPDDVACADPDQCKKICGNPVSCSDTAYARLVIELLPAGLRGLMMAVMIAAFLSSLTSIFNSSSTIFTMDLWKTFRTRASEWELMIVGRVFILVLVVVSVLWIPVVQVSQGGQLFIYIQSISNNLQPPVSIIFLTGCFWKRTNEKGAFWGLTIGMTVGVIRVILDFVYPTPLCYEKDDRPAVIKHVHFLYFSTMLSIITLVLVVVVSLATEEPRPEQISRLTWFTRFDPVLPKQELSSVGPSTEITEEVTCLDSEMDVKEKEMKSTNGEAFPQRRDPLSSTSSEENQSRLMGAIYWLCGMERKKEEDDNVKNFKPEPAINSLKENPYLRRIVNINLIFCLSVFAFLMGYWA